MPASSFRAFGLNIHSAFDVPGAGRISATRPDITIESGRATLPQVQETRGIYSVNAGSLLIRLPHADYLCEAGARIVVQEHDGAGRSETERFLAAVAIPALLWMRGAIVLHAGAVVLPGHSHAIVIAGDSGNGKSTLLRQLLEEGASIVADDTTALSSTRQGLAASGLPAAIWTAENPDAPEGQQNALDVPASRRCDGALVAAICVLAARGPGKEELIALPPDRAIAVLLQQRHRNNVPRLLGRAQIVLPELAAIVARTPVLAWRRRQGQPLLQNHERQALQDLTEASDNMKITP